MKNLKMMREKTGSFFCFAEGSWHPGGAGGDSPEAGPRLHPVVQERRHLHIHAAATTIAARLLEHADVHAHEEVGRFVGIPKVYFK